MTNAKNDRPATPAKSPAAAPAGKSPSGTPASAAARPAAAAGSKATAAPASNPSKPGASAAASANRATAAKPAASAASSAAAKPAAAKASTKPVVPATAKVSTPAKASAPETIQSPAPAPAKSTASRSSTKAAADPHGHGPHSQAGKPGHKSPSSKRKHLKLPAAGRRIGSENMLWAAVSFSLALHVVLLVLHFKYGDILPSRQVDKGLEVVLVNSRHAHAPKDPQVLAQTNLDAGGNTDQKVLPSTPVPPQDMSQEGEALLEMQRKVEQLEARQRELLKQSKAMQMADVAPAKPEEVEAAERAVGQDLLDTRSAIARQEALIRKQQQEYAERPRKAFVGARAKEYRFAQYVEDWRHRIERVGTLNFPQNAQGKLYGSLLLTVEVRYDGTVVGAEVKRSSGNKALDEHALRVLKLAAPFSVFPPNIRRDTDVIVISRTWTFSKSDTLDAAHGEN